LALYISIRPSGMAAMMLAPLGVAANVVLMWMLFV
jgi:hypothetical protein